MTVINFQPINSGLISTDTGTPVQFSLTNNSAALLNLYWIDRDGHRQLYTQLGNGEKYLQSTVSSHAWEVTSADGKIAFDFKPSSAGDIKITADLKQVFTDFSEKVTWTSDGLWSSSQGHGLIDAAKSLGVAHTADLPMNGQNNNLALNAMNAADAWAAGFTGKGVKVAVVDVGIAANAEINGRLVGGYDFFQNDKDASPNDGAFKDHALGVASIIAASHDANSGRDTMGVAPDAELLNVRVGSSVTGSSSDAIAKGLIWAVDNGAKVICMPLQNASYSADPQIAAAVHYAYQHNVVTVIIGGNFSSYGATGPATIAQQNNEAIAVGNYNVMSGSAFDSSNMPGQDPFNWVMASSSGYVPNSSGGYTYWSDGGTSFAGPYVAGLAALLFQQNPNATAAEIMSKIANGASLGGSAATADLPAVIQGTAGIDVSKFSHASSDYSIHIDGNSTIVTSLGDGSVTALSSIERLQFSDKAIALDITGNGGEIYRLYQAAFDRAPDKAGLGFWMNAMDHGTTLAQVANGFTHSDEFAKLYGAHPTDLDLVNAMYQNVLHRAPEKAGLDFWLGALHNGTTTEQLLTSFSDSAENISNIVKIIGQGFEYTPVV